MKRNNLLYVLSTGVVGLILLVAIASAWVGFVAAETCSEAKQFYQVDDCVAALTSQLDDVGRSYGERNDAIWALGQYGDTQALPALQRHYTGQIPDREPWHETLSQYELRKAIHLLEGGFNLTVIFRALTLGRV